MRAHGRPRSWLVGIASLVLVAAWGVRAHAEPARVNVGLYLQNITEIDIKTNSFTAELYLWFRWTGDVDPTLSYQITNAVNVSEMSATPIYFDDKNTPTPEVLPDGRKLQVFHVYGRFGHPFPLGKYPFDDHDIELSIEDAKHRSLELVYDVDVPGSVVRPDLVVPGWTLGRLASRVTENQFATTFGDTRSSVSAERYSHVDFMVHIDRPVIGIVSKTVIPIAIILLITFGAFFLKPVDIDARLCLTITALVSAVALQFTAATELPPTGSLLLLDKIYILSYATILAVTFCCIAANRLAHAEREDAAHKLDRWALGIIATLYFGSLVVFVTGAS